MTDPGALATSVVSTLMTFLAKAAGKGFEKGAESTAKTLFETLTKKLSHHDARAALDQLARTPGDEYSKAVLTVQLAQALKADPHLARELQGLLQARQPGGHNVGAGPHGQAAVADHSSTVIQAQGSGNTLNRG